MFDVAEVAEPQERPDKAGDTEEIERHGPAIACDQPARSRQTDDGTQRNTTDELRGGARPFRYGNPASEQIVNRREQAGFSHSHANANGNQHRHGYRGRQGRQERKQRPNNQRNAGHSPPAEPTSQQAGDEQERHVTEEERGQHPADLRFGPPELRSHGDRCNGDVDPVGKRDEAADKAERNQPPIQRPSARRASPIG
jgi:hypothetical protein